MARLFHGTRRQAAKKILNGGFRDSSNYYLTEEIHTGVWLSDRPLDGSDGAPPDVVPLVIEIPWALVEPYEWIEEGKSYREFLIPALIINVHGSVRLATEEELGPE